MRRSFAWLSLVAATLPLAACGSCRGPYKPKGPPPEYEEPKNPGPWPPAPSTSASTALPSSTSLSTSAADASATPTPAASGSATPSAVPSANTAPAAAIDPAFLPVADACKKDDDCANNTLVLTKDVAFQCCGGCTPTAGTKAWVAKVQKICEQKIKTGLKRTCPPWDCTEPTAPACIGGKCQLKP